MTLEELAAYAEEKYHIREQHKWDGFRGFSVLADPDTGKWVALLMRQWDYETGNELCRCDIKCGREILEKISAPYVTNAFRMKGNKWAGVMFDDRTEPETVFKLFDEAVRIGRTGGYTVVLEEKKKGENRGKIFSDTLLPLELMRGNYDRRRFREREEESRRKAQARTIDRNTGRVQIPRRILEMMQLYEYGTSSFENKCRNFVKQGKFMEDYEDDAPWNMEFRRYFTTYHDLNLNQLRGYFAWRTRVRRGEFYPITTSLAYMYIYELLNLIGAETPEDAVRKMRKFEAGYLDSGIGDSSMRENLHRWIMEFSVLSGSSQEEAASFIEPALLERDRQLMVLRRPQDHTDEEIAGALNALSGGKIEKSSAVRKEDDRGNHLFAEVWRYMAEHYDDEGWDIFTACFGKLRMFPWHPLANAIYMDKEKREESEYKVTECRKFVYKEGGWFEVRYDELYFDRYRVHGIVHEADRQIRRYLRTGSYLREKQGEEWISPYVEAVIEADKAAIKEAARPKITIDFSGLDKIRRDAQITRDSLLTEEEIREQTGEPVSYTAETVPQPAKTPVPETPGGSAVCSAEPPFIQLSVETGPKPFEEEEKTATIEIPSLDGAHAKILLSVMCGEPVAELIRQEHLMPSVVTDAINEAFFDEIGDNILECDGDEISLVEDYREDLMMMLEGDN